MWPSNANPAKRSARTLPRSSKHILASADLRNALESPAVDGAVKNKVIVAVAAKMGLNDAVRNFVCLIVDHRRTHLFHEILPVFGTELNKRLGSPKPKSPPRARSAMPRKKNCSPCCSAAPEKRSKRISPKTKTLLGGAVVRVGSTVYDGSVREQLNRLRERLETE